MMIYFSTVFHRSIRLRATNVSEQSLVVGSGALYVRDMDLVIPVWYWSYLNTAGCGYIAINILFQVIYSSMNS